MTTVFLYPHDTGVAGTRTMDSTPGLGAGTYSGTATKDFPWTPPGGKVLSTASFSLIAPITYSTLPRTVTPSLFIKKVLTITVSFTSGSNLFTASTVTGLEVGDKVTITDGVSSGNHLTGLISEIDLVAKTFRVVDESTGLAKNAGVTGNNKAVSFHEETLWTGEATVLDAGPAATLQWNGQFEHYHALDNGRKLFSRIALTGAGGAVTFGAETRFEIDVVDGANQETEVYTRDQFTLYQRRVREFVWTTDEARSHTVKTVFTRDTTEREVSIAAFTRDSLFHANTLSMFTLDEVSPVADLPATFISNLRVGRGEETLSLMETETLGREHVLADLVERLGKPPAIYTPPEPVVRPEPSGVLFRTAGIVHETAEVLRAHADPSVPTNIMQIFLPDSTVAGEAPKAVYVAGSGDEPDRWQLPGDYGSGFYHLAFISDAERLPPDGGAPLSIEKANSVWLVLRHRPVGALMQAEMGNNVPGQLVLSRNVTPEEAVAVWVWQRPMAPFDVQVSIRNPLLRPPGFVGLWGALLVA